MAVYKLKGSSSLNEQMVSWHLWEDVLGWIGVLLISVIMKFFDVPILDGIFSVLFTLFILFNVIMVLKQTLRILLQGKPENMDMDLIEKAIQALPNIISSHDLRLWSMDGRQVVMTLHVVVDKDCTKETIIEVKKNVFNSAKAYGITHVTTEVEYEGESCDLVPT